MAAGVSNCGSWPARAPAWRQAPPTPRPQLHHWGGQTNASFTPSLLPPDAQPRFVSKQQAFGASADTGVAPEGEAAEGAAARRRQLCGGALAAVPPYARPLGGTCPLTSRKVGC